MRLTKLTHVGKDERFIFINPEHVVSVEQFKDHVNVVTTAMGDGKAKSYAVKETIDIVTARFTLP